MSPTVYHPSQDFLNPPDYLSPDNRFVTAALPPDSGLLAPLNEEEAAEEALVFGQPRPRQLRNKKRHEPEQSLTMELPDAQTTSRWALNPNPCVAAFGLGPEGATCKTCTHLYRKTFSKTYIKCDLRPDSKGAGTDHRAGWDACGKYEPLVSEPAASTAKAAEQNDETDSSDAPWWTR